MSPGYGGYQSTTLPPYYSTSTIAAPAYYTTAPNYYTTKASEYYKMHQRREKAKYSVE
jgi:hypothetical protein